MQLHLDSLYQYKFGCGAALTWTAALTMIASAITLIVTCVVDSRPPDDVPPCQPTPLLRRLLSAAPFNMASTFVGRHLMGLSQNGTIAVITAGRVFGCGLLAGVASLFFATRNARLGIAVERGSMVLDAQRCLVPVSGASQSVFMLVILLTPTRGLTYL